MKQSICYLYEYENYKQTKNVGFIKTSFYKNKVTFQIHGKGLDCDKSLDLEMFLFTENVKSYRIDKVGSVEGVQGTVNYLVTVESLDADCVNQYDGVLLVSKYEKRYVASWKKTEIRLEHLQDNMDEDDEPSEVGDTDCGCYNEYKDLEPDFSCEIGEETCIESREVRELADDRKEDANEKHTNEYRKIDRHGISELPQREWRLSNNNFLLHGFSNYKHLMLIRLDNQLYLGIPGVYHNREELMAKSFGFPYFQKADVAALELEELEYSTEENFGYWCRPVTER